MNNYKELFERSYKTCCGGCVDYSKAEWISEAIFGYTTYDSYMDGVLVGRTLDACVHINDSGNSQLLKDETLYEQYITMVNMPFFQNRLEWGGSIRFPWWDYVVKPLRSWYLYDSEGGQVKVLEFDSRKDWESFIRQLVDWYNE